MLYRAWIDPESCVYWGRLVTGGFSMKKLLLASVALITITSVASAADLAPRTYTKAPPPIVEPGINWSGFYIGAMGGYGWSDRLRGEIPSLGLAGSISSDELNGGFGGGTIGYNWQTPGSPFVWGLEVDAAGSDISRSVTFPAIGVTLSDRIEAFGSVTGRIGYAVNAALFYAKGGYAWADNKVTASLVGFGSASESRVHSGWTVGGGLEYMFARNWSGKVEYMYADYGNETYADSAALPGGFRIGATVNTVKAGINYHFN
jgi:outer membrane immunogenic protein